MKSGVPKRVNFFGILLCLNLNIMQATARSFMLAVNFQEYSLVLPDQIGVTRGITGFRSTF